MWQCCYSLKTAETLSRTEIVRCIHDCHGNTILALKQLKLSSKNFTHLNLYFNLASC
jgi:hypothetical protein